MSNATYVGRVGGLAVALGVGFAIASTPATAWADDAANPGTTSAPAQNAAPDAAGTKKPGVKTGKTKRLGKASSEKQRTAKPEPTAADGPVTSQTTAKTVTGSTKKPTPRALKVDSETASPAPRAVGATASATSAVTPSVTSTATATNGAVSLMSASMLDSSATDGPVAPDFSPVAAVLAAWGTRTRVETQTKPAAVTSTSQPVVATAAQPVPTAAQPVPTAATTTVPSPWLNYSKSISVGTNPTAEVMGADGRLYVANTGSNTVSVINTTTGKRIDANPSWFSQDISVGTAPSALALSPDGTRLYVANSGSGTVSVINTVGYKRIDASPSTTSNDITVGTAPSALTVGADGRIYVANKGSDTVSVIDPTTYSVTGTIGVGTQPTALALGTGKVYVANQGSNTVSVLDTSTLAVTSIAVGTPPSALALGTGGKLYVASQTGGTLSTIDTATNTVTPGAITVGPAPSSVAVSADGSVAYVANGNDTVSVINTGTSAVVSTVRFDTDATGGHAVAVAPNGAVYVSDAADRTVRVLVQPSLIATSVTKIGSVGVTGVGSTVLSNDGTRALVITGPAPTSTTSTTRVAVIDTATGKQVGSTVSIAGKPVVPAFSADGTRAVITAAGTTATQLAVIDLATGKQTGTTLTLPGAVGVQLLSADGSRALTTTYGTGITQVAVLNTLTGAQTGATVSVTGNQLEAPVLNADRTRALITTSRPIWEAPDTTRIAVLDTTTGTQLGTTVEIAGNEVAPPALNADGSRAAISTQIGDFASGYTTQATILNVATGSQIGTTQGLEGQAVYGAPVFNAAGNRVAFLARTEDPTNTFTTRLAVLDAVTGNPVGTGLVVDGDGARDLSADRTRIVVTATSTDPGTQVTTTRLATVDLATGNQVGDVTLPGTWHALLMTPDGGRAVTISGDNTATHAAVIDTLTGAQTGTTLNLVGSEFGSRLISLDGSRALIVTAVYNGATSVNTERLTVLDTTTGAQVGNTLALTGFLNGVQYSPDTDRVVAMTISSNFNTTGVPTSQVAVLDTTTGLQLGSTLTLKPDNGYLVLSAGGTRAVVSTGSQFVVINTTNGTQVGGALTGVGSNPLLTADGSRALTTGVSYNFWTRTYTTTARVLKIV